MREVELKLAVDEPFLTPALTAGSANVAGMEELPALDLRATYYDTHDLRLARHGITLRYRTGDGSEPGWTLKLPVGGGDGATREEIHFAGPGAKVPTEARDLVLAFARAASLAPVARLRTRRRRWSLRGSEGTELAELVDDRVSVLRRGRVVERFRELEIEGRALDREGLERIASTLQQAGASAPEAVPKAVRALGAKAQEPPDVIVPESLSPSDPAAYAIQAAIGRGLQRMLANDPGVRLGEVEAVHQMRVGARRLRSDLRTFAQLLDREWVDGLRAELRWLGQELGAVRDLDVLGERLRASGEGLGGLEPLFRVLEDRHSRAREQLLEGLRSPRYVALVDALVEANGSPAVTADAWQPSANVLPPLAAKAWQKLAARARKLRDGDPAEDYHRVRILAKKSRYAAEAIAPALGSRRGRQATRFARRAAAIQDVLGLMQDAVVARDTVLAVASSREDDGLFNVSAGRLVERQAFDARSARADLPAAWRRLDRKKRRRWLRT
jgi:inorganic triphosphatase YgiF